MSQGRVARVGKVIWRSLTVLAALAAIVGCVLTIRFYCFNPQTDCEYVETRLPDRQQMLADIDIKIEEFQSQGYDVYGWQQDAIQAKAFLEQARELWHDERCPEAKSQLKESGELIQSLRVELGLPVEGAAVYWYMILLYIIVCSIAGLAGYYYMVRKKRRSDNS